ncbi:hypothetical protein CFP56_031856 [Quercus suber]|uniref:Uncharacterized protein n=1 Tax=Quercus suber TaxID=58331 RepID=A0AAW0LTY1_QUESU
MYNVFSNFEELAEVLSKTSNLRLMIIKEAYNFYHPGHHAVSSNTQSYQMPKTKIVAKASINCKMFRRAILFFPKMVKLSIWSQSLSQWLPYDERHSQKEFTILVHFLQVQGLLCRKTVYGTSSKGEEDESITEFQIIMPPCLTEIVENSISIELPSNWYKSKWIGLALWALVTDPRYAGLRVRTRVVAIGKMPQNHYAFELFTTQINVEVKTAILFNNYLLYLSRDEWFATVGNGVLVCTSYNDFYRMTFN